MVILLFPGCGTFPVWISTTSPLIVFFVKNYRMNPTKSSLPVYFNHFDTLLFQLLNDCWLPARPFVGFQDDGGRIGLNAGSGQGILQHIFMIDYPADYLSNSWNNSTTSCCTQCHVRLSIFGNQKGRYMGTGPLSGFKNA